MPDRGPPPSPKELLELQDKVRVRFEHHGELAIAEDDAFEGWQGSLPIFSRFPRLQKEIAGTAIRAIMPDEAEELAIVEGIQAAYFLPHFSQSEDKSRLTSQFPATLFMIDSQAIFIERDVVTKTWTSSRYLFDEEGNEVISDDAPLHMTQKERWSLLEIMDEVGYRL